jgi:hypothetical protein
MTAIRRVAAIEASLQPGELVRHVLAEALAFGGLAEYTRFMIGQPEEAAPLSRIASGTDAAVRASMKGQPRELVEDAVRRAVGDGMFAFILVLRIFDEWVRARARKLADDARISTFDRLGEPAARS